jgi:large subunit ribosomal protein L3
MRPVTVIEIQDNVVVQAKTMAKEGYDGLQLGAGWQKRKRVDKGVACHFANNGIELKRDLLEFRVSADALLPVGTRLPARHFVPGQFVDVQATTKGKGFAGVMKRHGFSGGNASHGATKVHRAPGSLGGGTNSHTGGKVVKGKKMPGNMGNETRTQQNLQVYRVDPARNLVCVLGCIPGTTGAVVKVSDTKKPLLVPPGQPRPPFPTFLGAEGEAEVRARAAARRGVRPPAPLTPARVPSARRRSAPAEPDTDDSRTRTRSRWIWERSTRCTSRQSRARCRCGARRGEQAVRAGAVLAISTLIKSSFKKV